MWHEYPYTDAHELNLDWFLKEFKTLVETWEQVQSDWNSLHDFVQNYFDNLNVQTEIDNKINAMIADGSFALILTPLVEAALPTIVDGKLPAVVASQIGAVVASQIGAVVAGQLPAVAAQAAADEVSSWLVTHIDPDTGYVIDDSLTVSLAAADAKVVGDFRDSFIKSINYFENVAEKAIDYNQSENIFDLSNTDLILHNKALTATGLIQDLLDFNVIFIPVHDVSVGYGLLYSNSAGTLWSNQTIARTACYDALFNLLGLATLTEDNIAEIPYPNTRYLVFQLADTYLSSRQPMIIEKYDGNTRSSYIPYTAPNPIAKVTIEKTWTGKTWAAYGDSITAMSNGDSLNVGWAKYVNTNLDFSQFHGRGIGGQSFTYNIGGGSVSFIEEATGLYNSRNDSYTKDNYTGAIPAGCVAVRGCFCSWDRITHMFPESIKDTIDLIYIMGGTNDNHSTTEAVFVPSDTTDPEWAASSYYSTYGGDFNINTIKGGVASCIMKMQAWMPNALIVLGTPLSGRGTTGELNFSMSTVDYEKSFDIIDVAKRLSIPCIDVNATSGINGLNRTTYIVDNVHPNTGAGSMMLGRTVASGLMSILPKMAY